MFVCGYRFRRGPTHALFAIFAAAAAQIGCGGEGGEVPATTHYPVKGAVRLADGKPLTSGRVVFSANNSTITFEGMIESDGSFAVKGSTGDGLPEGSYKIRIELDDAKSSQVQGKTNPRRGVPPFPAKYLDEDQSGLTATIKAGSNPPLELTLKK